MSRKHKHEDHVNHEAWAIPYGDLVTLLLAFFVVMYSISSVNEGKFKVMSESLSEAFGGVPRSVSPIQLGKTSRKGSDLEKAPPINIAPVAGPIAPSRKHGWQLEKTRAADEEALRVGKHNLDQIGTRIVEAMDDLIRQDLVEVKRSPLLLEVELKSDIFFDSGSAVPNPQSVEIMRRLAASLAPFPNPIRIEGHTDNIPIKTFQFPSNWELSAARAASVVHVFIENGVAPARLSVVGYSDQVPKQDNATAIGRATNRRVVLVIPATPEGLQSEGGDAAVPMEGDAEGAPIDTAPAGDTPTSNEEG